MKKIVLFLGVALFGLAACREQPDTALNPATDVPAGSTSANDGDATQGNAGAGRSLLLRVAETGENQIWRFDDGVEPSIDVLWAVTPEWSLLAFVPNGWGDADLAVWRSTATDEVRLWKVREGAEEPVAEVLPPAAAGWRIAAVLDVDADGRADLVWTGPNGEVAVWTLRDGKVVGQDVIGNTGSGWTLAQTGDFDGDGRGDLFWRKDDRTSASIWTLGGLAIKDTIGIADAGDQWALLAAGRFDGDAGSDLLWRDTAGNLAIWSGADPARASGVSRQAPSDWTFLGALDLDGNGHDDLLWNNPEKRQSGAWMLAAGGAITDRSLPPVGKEWTAVPSSLVTNQPVDSL